MPERMKVTPKKGSDRTSLDSGGEPPNDDGMEARVVKIETDLTVMKSDIAVIRSNYATKEDLHKEMSAQTWKLVTFVCSFGVTLVGVTYYMATHIK